MEVVTRENLNYIDSMICIIRMFDEDRSLIYIDLLVKPFCESIGFKLNTRGKNVKQITAILQQYIDKNNIYSGKKPSFRNHDIVV